MINGENIVIKIRDGQKVKEYFVKNTEVLKYGSILMLYEQEASHNASVAKCKVEEKGSRLTPA